MQVAIYARVSTSHQEKKETIESQVESLKAYVKSQGEEVNPEHVFIDNGVSGTRLDRPALDRLRDQASWGEFEAVIISSPDRLARKYPHQWLLEEEFKKCGCSVIFLENPYGDSSQGQLLAGMQGVIAEYERSQILERTRRGRLHKARKGEYSPWLSQTYGYRYTPKQGHLPPVVEIDVQQAAVIKDMFQWLITEQLSTRQIVKRLNQLKIPTNTQRNSVWQPSSVRSILTNFIYTGRGYYNKTKRGVALKESVGLLQVHKEVEVKEWRPREEWIVVTAPPIIDQETFEKAQEQLKRNREKAFRSYQVNSGRYLLKRLVCCGKCGLRMAAHHQKSGSREYLYYVCPGKDPLTIGRRERCPSKRLRANCLDEVVWESIQELIQKPQVIIKEYELWQEMQQNQGGAFSEQLQRMEAQAKNLQKQQQRLIDAYQQEVIILKELSRRKEQIQQRLKALATQRKEVVSQQKASIKWNVLVENIEEFKKLLGKNLHELSFQERQAIAQLLVEKVIIHLDGKVEIYHILPFEEKPVADEQKKKVMGKDFYLLRSTRLIPVLIRPATKWLL
jgi:site-specific DNA recombinase